MEWINQFDVFFVNSANNLLKSAGYFFTPVFKGYTRIYFSAHYASDIAGGIFMRCFKFLDILAIR